MKRAIPNIEEMKGIREWLGYDSIDSKLMFCPFPAKKSQRWVLCAQDQRVGKDRYCVKFFPKMNNGKCPCVQFKLKYVTKVAKQLLEEGGK